MSLLKKFDGINGAKFITIKNYLSSTSGEVSNQNINVNVSIDTAKRKDLETLKSFDVNTLSYEDKEFAQTVLDEMIDKAEQNLSKDISERTTQSQAQLDAYIPLGKGLKINKETQDLYITGFVNSKTVLVEGEYPKRNKREKTKVKELIEKSAGLKMRKYRNFRLSNIGSVSITGDTIQINVGS